MHILAKNKVRLKKWFGAPEKLILRPQKGAARDGSSPWPPACYALYITIN